MTDPAWIKPRRIVILVDNDSMILPYAERLVDEVRSDGEAAQLVRHAAHLPESDVAFLLGCMQVVPDQSLRRSRFNLVVHASNLPKGRGFSPMTWQILEGQTSIPICLFNATCDIDAGSVIYRDTIELLGNETHDEWRSLQGQKTIELCRRFLSESAPPEGSGQSGEPTFYPRRTPYNSRLDPNRTIAEQFNLLRVADSDRYPAYFFHHGRRYMLVLSPDERPQRERIFSMNNDVDTTYIVAASRQWNILEFSRRVPDFPGRWLLVSEPTSFSIDLVRSLRPRYVFFPHWSWKVPDDILAATECVCFHMTDVPFGRGGSPLQNLIVRGHTETRLSALRMVSEPDAGPVYMKRDLSLHGAAHEIFARCTSAVFDMIGEITTEQAEPIPQTGTPVVFRRRRPSESRLPRKRTRASRLRSHSNVGCRRISERFSGLRRISGRVPRGTDPGGQARSARHVPRGRQSPLAMRSILVVAAHPDDEILGCGGVLASHAANGDTVHVLIVAEGATSRNSRRDPDAREPELAGLKAAASSAASAIGAEAPRLLGLPDNRPRQPASAGRHQARRSCRRSRGTGDRLHPPRGRSERRSPHCPPGGHHGMPAAARIAGEGDLCLMKRCRAPNGKPRATRSDRNVGSISSRSFVASGARWKPTRRRCVRFHMPGRSKLSKHSRGFAARRPGWRQRNVSWS